MPIVGAGSRNSTRSTQQLARLDFSTSSSPPPPPPRFPPPPLPLEKMSPGIPGPFVLEQPRAGATPPAHVCACARCALAEYKLAPRGRRRRCAARFPGRSVPSPPVPPRLVGASRSSPSSRRGGAVLRARRAARTRSPARAAACAEAEVRAARGLEPCGGARIARSSRSARCRRAALVVVRRARGAAVRRAARVRVAGLVEVRLGAEDLRRDRAAPARPCSCPAATSRSCRCRATCRAAGTPAAVGVQVRVEAEGAARGREELHERRDLRGTSGGPKLHPERESRPRLYSRGASRAGTRQAEEAARVRRARAADERRARGHDAARLERDEDRAVGVRRGPRALARADLDIIGRHALSASFGLAPVAPCRAK